MNGDDHKERRTVIQVTDKQTELQSMVQTVFTFMIICVLSWIGLTLEKVKDNTAENNTQLAVFNTNQIHLTKKLEDHINDPKAHD